MRGLLFFVFARTAYTDPEDQEVTALAGSTADALEVAL